MLSIKYHKPRFVVEKLFGVETTADVKSVKALGALSNASVSADLAI